MKTARDWPPTPGAARRRLLLLLLLATLAASAATASSASARTVWLCRPGLARDPCTPGLATTVFSSTGANLGIRHPKAVRRPGFDCFYVYPTISDQTTTQSNRHVDPVDRSIALYQVTRFSQYCRVFAPMYRQLTLPGLLAPPLEQLKALLGAYADVLVAWRDYLTHFNHGRPFVLIGHSQGSFMLKTLLRQQIDRRPSLRGRLLSAILPGTNVLVRAGSDIGGDFMHVPACRSPRQLHCVIAFSTFDETPPPNAHFGTPTGFFTGLFGEPAGAGYEVLCSNPAALGGGSGALDAISPTAPFAPGTIATARAQLGAPLPHASTPWVELPGSFTARCSSSAGANVLEVTPNGAIPRPNPVPDATWGLHLLDSAIALGDLVRVVEREAGAYTRSS